MTEKNITWREDNTPQSNIFDDIYYLPETGLEESKTVFLEGIDAPLIWQNKKIFRIGELGFGTGLNFLVTLKTWLETTHDDQKLHFISTEKYPLSKDDVEKAVHWSELQSVLSVFLEEYPNEKLELFGGRVTLEILFGDSLETLSQTQTKMDAWYLDGFAPSKNPDMWSDALFGEVARLSKRGAKLATFTAAGFVRRGLIDQGFQMVKRPGFGYKREMLCGTFDIVA